MNEDLLFELSGILERVQDEGYVFHVYPGLVLRSVKRGHL